MTYLCLFLGPYVAETDWSPKALHLFYLWDMKVKATTLNYVSIFILYLLQSLSDTASIIVVRISLKLSYRPKNTFSYIALLPRDLSMFAMVCNKAPPKQVQHSYVWKYFTEDDTNNSTVKCQLSSAVLKYNKNTSAMHNHLKMKHPLPKTSTSSSPSPSEQRTA